MVRTCLPLLCPVTHPPHQPPRSRLAAIVEFRRTQQDLEARLAFVGISGYSASAATTSLPCGLRRHVVVCRPISSGPALTEISPSVRAGTSNFPRKVESSEPSERGTASMTAACEQHEALAVPRERDRARVSSTSSPGASCRGWEKGVTACRKLLQHSPHQPERATATESPRALNRCRRSGLMKKCLRSRRPPKTWRSRVIRARRRG